MADDSIKISIVADKSDLTAKIAETKKDLADMANRANTDSRLKIQISIAEMQAQLDKARANLRAFKASGDADAQIIARMEINSLNNSIAQARANLKAVGREGKTAMDSIKASSQSTADSFLQLKTAMIGIFSINMVSNFIEKMFDFTSQVQQAKIAFTQMFHSEQQATALMGDIQQFAKVTPFNQLGLIEGAKRLSAYGFTAKQILPTLNAIGEAVSAVGGGSDTLNGVVVALGQMQTKGKLVQQEINQIAERGIPIYDILKEKLHLTREQLADIGNQGIESAKAIPLILEALNERFGGLMAKQAKTLQGAWSNLQDTTQIAMARIGESQSGAIVGLITKLTNFLTTNQDKLVSFAGAIADNVKIVFKVMGEALNGASILIALPFMAIYKVADFVFGAISGKADESAEKGIVSWTGFFNWVLLGLSALIGGFKLAFESIGTILGGAMGGLLASYSSGFEVLWEAAITFGKAWGALWDNVGKGTGDTLGTGMYQGLYKALNKMNGLINEFTGFLNEKFHMVWGKLPTNLGEVFGPKPKPRDLAGDQLRPQLDKLDSAVKKFKQDWSAGWDSAGKEVATNAQNMITGLVDQWAEGEQRIKSTQGGLADRTKDYAKMLKEAFAGLNGNQGDLTKQTEKQSKAQKEAISLAKDAIGDYEKKVGDVASGFEKLATATKEAFTEVNDTIAKASDKIKTLQEGLSTDQKKQTDDFVSDIAKRDAELAKKEQDLQDKIADIKKTAQDKQETINQDSLDKQKTLQEDLVILEKRRGEQTDKTSQSAKDSLELQIQRKKNEIANLKTQDSVTESTKSQLDAQEQLNEVLNERKKIQEMIKAFTDQDATAGTNFAKSFSDALTNANLTDAEQRKKTFDDAMKQKQEEVQAEIDAQNQIIAIQKTFAGALNATDTQSAKNKLALVRMYKDGTINDDKAMTDFLAQNGINDVTQTQLEEAQKQALKIATLEAEKADLVTQQEDILSVKKQYMDLVEQANKESVDRQIIENQRLIDQINLAIQAQQTLNALRDSYAQAQANAQASNTDNSKTNNITINTAGTADTSFALDKLTRTIK